MDEIANIGDFSTDWRSVFRAEIRNTERPLRLDAVEAAALNYMQMSLDLYDTGLGPFLLRFRRLRAVLTYYYYA